MKKRVPGLTDSSLDRFLRRARKAAKLHGTVNVLVTNSRELQTLNRRFRGKNEPTDVLSFPPAAVLQNGFAGDVAISADIATESARRLGHSLADEIKILSLHGLLHLAGYDHETDRGEMARKERALRESLRLPVSLIERAEQSIRATAKARARKKGKTAR